VNLPARGRAAGKVILLGEHAVVYGRPALAAGLAIGLEVEVTAATGPARLASDRPELADDPRPDRLVRDAAAALGLEARDFVVRVRSELPAGAGLGSSAALAVALLRALARVAGRSLARDEELALGRRLEAIFHGHPSGIDPAAAALGGCFRFVRGEPPAITPLRPGRPLPLVIALGARPRSTGAAVTGLRERWEAEGARHERLFDEVAVVVEHGARAVEAGDLAALGRAFDRNQELLTDLGVSAPEVEALARAARAAGALGAKLTGGGAGGAVLALAAEPDRIAAALGAQGVETIVVHVGAAEEAAA
jgi:mevalonate kinase